MKVVRLRIPVKIMKFNFDFIGFITGNSSFEPLLEGLFAQILIDLS